MTSESINTSTVTPHYRYLWLFIAATGIAYATLLVILTWANVVEETGSIARWAIQCLPLLLVLPGLLLRKYRAYSWLCFIVVLYFIPAVLKVMDPRGHWSDTLLLIASIVIFITGAYSSRWLQRSQPEQNKDHHE